MNYRQEFVGKPKRIVVKLGSNAVTKEEGGVSLEKISRFVDDIAFLHKLGLEIILVSSGAIQTGLSFLPLNKKKTIEDMQALSAIGQPVLMKSYIDLFSAHGLICSQVLLTHDDLKNTTRYLNVRQTLGKLLENKILPILNENDSVSFQEITVGDNDQLAAMVAQLIDADTLLLFSTPDGLFDEDPTLLHQKNSLEKSPQRLPVVGYDENFSGIKLMSQSLAGRGGMSSKLKAVRKVTPLGIRVVLSTFKNEKPLLRALTESVGTYFSPHPLRLGPKRKSWLLTLTKHDISIEVDEGAYLALMKSSSLLPSGVLKVEGKFKRGDCLELKYRGEVFAVGLAEYDSGEIVRIAGKKTHEIQNLLGYYLSKVVIHRDNLVLKKYFEERKN